MEANILSLNTGLPQKMVWQGKEAFSSMEKTPTGGKLIVNQENIDGDRFAEVGVHGTPDSVVYAFGMDAAQLYMDAIEGGDYLFGALGENLSLDFLNEDEVSVGDVFQVGDVKLQATFPRIPCAKVNIRMKHPRGQKALLDLGRSGVYFRVLQPGEIKQDDKFIRIKKADHFFSIGEVYKIHISRESWNKEHLDRARENGYFPEGLVEKYAARL